jgi:ubiquinone biosynthesis protein COQ9
MEQQAALIDAILPLVPRMGWTRAALARAAGDAGLAANAFPGGPRDAVVAWSALADRRMAEAVGDLSALRTPARIRRLTEIRLTQAEPHREALRQALALMAAPWNLPKAAQMTARTSDAMWHAAGDCSHDWSWYTRRASLSAVYGATLAYWLSPSRGDVADALAFLDRRLADLARMSQRTKRG